jgi:hypothetical protein
VRGSFDGVYPSKITLSLFGRGGGMVFFEIAQLNTGYRYLLIPITKSAGYKSDISYRIMEEVSNGLL